MCYTQLKITIIKKEAVENKNSCDKSVPLFDNKRHLETRSVDDGGGVGELEGHFSIIRLFNNLLLFASPVQVEIIL